MLSRRDFIRGANGVALTIPFFGLIACDEKPTEGAHSFSGKTMGTTYNVKIAGADDSLDADALAQRILASLQNVDDLMSTYNNASELSLANADNANAPRKVSDDTARVVRTALNAANLTSGAFDPTIGPLVDLWGFGPAGSKNAVPAESDITVAKNSVGYGNITLNGTELRKSNAETRMDLSGIAKGYGVDKVAELLDAEGVENYLVEVGGEVRTRGLSPEDRPWRLGIEKPMPGTRDIQRVVDLSGHALASSGNYRIFFEAEGERFAHIIDPRTGRPISHDLASVTVIAPSTMEADTLSTAMLVMGPREAMDFAEKHEIAAFFISGSNGEFTESTSSTFEKLFSA